MAANAATAYVDKLRRHAIDLLRLDASMRKKVLAILRNLEKQITAQLIGSDVGSGLTQAQEVRLNAMLQQAKATIDAHFGVIVETVAPQLSALAVIEGRWIKSAIDTAIHTTMLTEGLTVEQLSAMAGNTLIKGAPSAEWWSDQSARLQKSFANEMRSGLALGETNQDLVRRVRGTRENGFRDGLMRVPTRDAEALVRTSVQAVANEARSMFYKENDDVIKGYIYHATLDARTTQQCAALDGLKWDLEGDPVDHEVRFQQPPVHWNCRSTLLPWIKSFKELGIDTDEFTPATRSSMDGQVPADQSFDEWLASKDQAQPGFAADLLGKGKAELWQDGKINFLDLIDQSGRPLTLEQIEKRL